MNPFMYGRRYEGPHIPGENPRHLPPDLQGADKITLRISWCAHEGKEHTHVDHRCDWQIEGMRMASKIDEVRSLLHKLRLWGITRKITGTKGRKLRLK